VKKVIILVGVLAAAAACRTDIFFGLAEGAAAKVVAPNGRTPFYGAGVTIEGLKEAGYYAQTKTDANGNFSFPATPDGQYRVTITSSNGLFQTAYMLEVEDGYSAGDVEILAAPAHAESFINVPGRYDDMGVVLKDLGYRFRTLDAATLAVAPSPFDGADLVCLDSGVDASSAENAAVIDNLRQFVAAGGRLMVSDRAWPFVRAAWPNAVVWPNDPEVGGGNQKTPAAFAAEDLRRCATVDRWRLYYRLAGWALPTSTSGTVFVQGDVETAGGTQENAPLLVGFSYGRGYVTYATFDWRTQYDESRLAIRSFHYLITNN